MSKRFGFASSAGLAGLLAVAAVASLLAGNYLPAVVMAERWVADYRIATLLPPQPPHPEIVVVAVTEDTLEQFPYRSPIDRDFLADLLELLQARDVKAIGIDLLFDQPTEEAKDRRLASVLRGVTVPVAVSYAGQSEGLSEHQVEFLNGFVPEQFRAFANLSKDPFDGTVRWIFPGRKDDGGRFRRGLVTQLSGKLGGFVPTGEVPISWRGPPDGNGAPPFRIIPAHAAGVVPASWLRDKIVLIGSDLSLTDRHRTPFSVTRGGPEGSMAGVTIHAHALATLLAKRQGFDVEGPMLIGVVIAAVMLGGMTPLLPLPLHVRLLGSGATVAAFWLVAFAAFREWRVMLPLVTPTLGFGIATWMAEAFVSRRERQLKSFLKDAFSRYMSPSLVNQLVADPRKLALGGERREMTFLFTDVAGFTTLSENIEPAALGVLLNDYFNGICHIIMEEGGTVVDFIGDAAFAIFGAPLEQVGHAVRGIACARRIDAFSEEFRRRDDAVRWGWGETRIGVHCGHALVGNFGSDLKFKYAPVGDAVNTGSRLEGLNKMFGTRICVSEPAAIASGIADLRPLGRFIFLGKGKPVTVFEPVDTQWHGSAVGKNYVAAYTAMAEGRSEEAVDQFQAALRQGLDLCTEFHIERLRKGERSDIIEMRRK